LQKVAPMKMKSGKEYACFLRCAGRMLERPARASTLVLAASFRSRPSPFLHPKSSQGLVRNGSALLKGEDGDDAERAVLPRF
jgi:hypothetical protein